MATPHNVPTGTEPDSSSRGRSFVEAFRQERSFLMFIGLALIVAGVSYPYPGVAMWVGFAFAGYSAIANDSIQTIGTFIASNSDRKWWVLWLYIAFIFLLTVGYSWLSYDGDVSSQRLASEGFSEAPTSFAFLQVAAPIILLILTRMRMPVSTTFLLLSSFSSKPGAIGGVILKSLSGYVVAFLTAITIWFLLNALIQRILRGKAHPGWVVFQWISSGILWSLWIAHDAANIAIYLPRQLNLTEFLVFAGYIFLGLGVLFYLRGDRIQRIVTEKTAVTDIRAASIIDFVYAIILFVFKELSNVPMSTTWVFLGLLGGREVAIGLRGYFEDRRSARKAFRIIGKDLVMASIGLLISIIIAVAVNSDMREGLLSGMP